MENEEKKRVRRWSEEEQRILIECYPTMNTADLPALLPGRSIHSIQARASSLQLKKPPEFCGFFKKGVANAPGAHHWTPEEDDLIRKHFPVRTAEEVAELIGGSRMSRNRIWRRAKQLGVVKSPEFKSHKCFDQRKKRASKYWYKSGHVPDNKGKRMPDALRERLAPFWFQKGGEAYNAKHDGAISVRKDANGHEYQFIRIAKKEWVHLHRYMWEKAHGAVPDDHLITFINGNTMDCRLENLEMVTRKAHMLKHTIHNYPVELKKAIRAHSKLIKTIKHGSKE